MSCCLLLQAVHGVYYLGVIAACRHNRDALQWLASAHVGGAAKSICSSCTIRNTELCPNIATTFSAINQPHNASQMITNQHGDSPCYRCSRQVVSHWVQQGMWRILNALLPLLPALQYEEHACCLLMAIRMAGVLVDF
jgi:hypothetical protein